MGTLWSHTYDVQAVCEMCKPGDHTTEECPETKNMRWIGVEGKDDEEEPLDVVQLDIEINI